jgi:hypothetical protein
MTNKVRKAARYNIFCSLERCDRRGEKKEGEPCSGDSLFPFRAVIFDAVLYY